MKKPVVLSFSSTCRLRHEQRRPIKVDRGGPSEYQMLEIWRLEPTKEPRSPRCLNRNKNDPLSFAEDIDISI